MSILNTTINTSSGFNSVTSNYTIRPSVEQDPVLTVERSNNTLTIKGKCLVNGKDLEERLENIEKVLGIPEAPADMFTKYPHLKKKYDSYINELAKLRTWDSLKT